MRVYLCITYFLAECKLLEDKDHTNGAWHIVDA